MHLALERRKTGIAVTQPRTSERGEIRDEQSKIRPRWTSHVIIGPRESWAPSRVSSGAVITSGLVEMGVMNAEASITPISTIFCVVQKRLTDVYTIWCDPHTKALYDYVISVGIL